VDLSWKQTQLAWVAALAEHADEGGTPVLAPGNQSVIRLCQLLLKLGGARACIPFVEASTSDFIRAQGSLFSAQQILIARGARSDCHTNCAKTWKASQGRYQIMTGYGLSNDTWRRHSWLISDNLVLTETTVRRDMYFGVVLTDAQAQSFYQAFIKG
jgi:hypothetical protein